LLTVETIEAEEIAKRSMEIASDLCVYTNKQFVMEVVEAIES
jgi:ATP-dependent protease HslVU (ClpYQ) peptidase subunit